MVKKEIEGRIGPIKGKYSSEYAEKYEILIDAICASEKILRGCECSEEDIAKIMTALKVLEDSKPDKIKTTIEKALSNALRECKTRDECSVCKFFNPEDF